MVSPYAIYIFLFLLGFGTVIVFASSNLLFAWMGLELNMLAVLPLLLQHRHPRATEAATKYFITQAAAAAVFLFAALSNSWLTGGWEMNQFPHPFVSALGFCALAMKMGLAPLHAWLPEVLQAMKLQTAVLLATWQKLAPFTLLIQLYPLNPDLLELFGFFSIVVGGWGGMTQTQLRKLLAYSSIGHLGWMMLILYFFPLLAFTLLLIYICLTIATFLLLMINKATSINMLSMSWANTPFIVAVSAALFMSLAGLPPLAGFIPKLLGLAELAKQGHTAPAMLAAVATLLGLIFYLRLVYAMASTISPNSVAGLPAWRIHPSRLSLLLAITSVTAITAIPMLPAAYAFIQ
nr:NADH dehydrogenase subunit 2 [Polydactylus sexfilis]